jgi:lipoprotein-anchoring transpeptidase ErfK/SrfK
MFLRAVAVTALVFGLAGLPREALAQFQPPGSPAVVPPPFRLSPPGAVEDDDLPPYDPPPGFRRPLQAGPMTQPPRTYEQEALPPPGFESDPRGPSPRPQLGAMPPQPALPPLLDNILRPPMAVGPAQPRMTDPDITSRLPMDDRPETGPRKELPPQFRRTTVDYNSREPAGTIVIDTANTYLYLVLGGGKAMRYGIGVGREGFTWAGAERVSKMAEWPDWHPPAEMIERQPYLPRFMAGGEGNPLGARALYLGRTLYRIHGTNQPSTIGSFVSSGCIRLTNEDITDLYQRVKVGTRVVVLAGKPPAAVSSAPVAPMSPARAPVPAAQQAENYGDPISLQPPGMIPSR